MDDEDKKKSNDPFETTGIKPGKHSAIADVWDTEPIKPGPHPHLRLREALTKVIKGFGASKGGGRASTRGRR